MAPAYDDTAPTGLAAGRDYPRTYREFVQMFPDDLACAAWLEQLRWPSGLVCPKCETAAAPWRHTGGRLVCSSCRHQGSVTAGTILDKTRPEHLVRGRVARDHREERPVREDAWVQPRD